MANAPARPQSAERSYVRKIDRGDDSAPVYVTSSGAEFVRADEVLKSVRGRKLLDLMGELQVQSK